MYDSVMIGISLDFEAPVFTCKIKEYNFKEREQYR
jgi:hypothetical protein